MMSRPRRQLRRRRNSSRSCANSSSTVDSPRSTRRAASTSAAVGGMPAITWPAVAAARTSSSVRVWRVCGAAMSDLLINSDSTCPGGADQGVQFVRA
ncbi:hypothetical protein KTR9_5008 (plasmid) [Gordonia sp. KTR9]|nr:hypothetical protein KTR9_5008 [Gordonia sp. KTR9]